MRERTKGDRVKHEKRATTGGQAVAEESTAAASESVASTSVGGESTGTAVAEAPAPPSDPRQQVEHIRVIALKAAKQYPLTAAQATASTLLQLGYDVLGAAMNASEQVATLDKLCQGPTASWEKTTDLGQAWRWANDGHLVVAGQKGAGKGHTTIVLGGPGRRSELLHRDVPLVADGSSGGPGSSACHLGRAFAASDLQMKKVGFYRPKLD